MKILIKKNRFGDDFVDSPHLTKASKILYKFDSIVCNKIGFIVQSNSFLRIHIIYWFYIFNNAYNKSKARVSNNDLKVKVSEKQGLTLDIVMEYSVQTLYNTILFIFAILKQTLSYVSATHRTYCSADRAPAQRQHSTSTDTAPTQHRHSTNTAPTQHPHHIKIGDNQTKKWNETHTRRESERKQISGAIQSNTEHRQSTGRTEWEALLLRIH